MGNGMAIEDALRALESAFLPLGCVAESLDHGNGARFRVFASSGATSLSIDGLLKGQLSDARRLNDLILHAREDLIERGYELSSWEFPSTTP